MRRTAVRASFANDSRGEVEACRARHAITWSAKLFLGAGEVLAALGLESLLVEVVTLVGLTLLENVSANVFLHLRSNCTCLGHCVSEGHLVISKRLNVDMSGL